MDKTRSLTEIFITFLKVGLILLGGGYVILPILQDAIVEKKNWLTQEELVDYYAISQSLPGLIAINISIFAGYKLRGKWGALVAVSGLIFSAFWTIVLISSLLTSIASNSLIKGAFWGIELAVIVLIISAIREMWSKAIVDKSSFVIYLLALCLMLVLDISPVYIIIASMFLGVGYKYIVSKRGEQ